MAICNHRFSLSTSRSFLFDGSWLRFEWGLVCLSTFLSSLSFKVHFAELTCLFPSHLRRMSQQDLLTLTALLANQFRSPLCLADLPLPQLPKENGAVGGLSQWALPWSKFANQPLCLPDLPLAWFSKENGTGGQFAHLFLGSFFF